MRLPRFEYHKPSTLDECLDLLQENGARSRILAGGTDLLVNMKYRVTCPELVLGIRGLQELLHIIPDEKGYLSIGASVTLAEIADNRQVAEEFPSFHAAVKSVASKHVRNMGTLGGNLCLDTRCWYYNKSKLWRDAREVCHKLGGRQCHAIKGSARCHAINSSDTVPVLLALGAKVKVLRKGQERILPVKDFFQDNGAQPNVLLPDEMLSAVLIPREQGQGCSAFIKIALRTGIDFALGSIAGYCAQNGSAGAEVRLVLGSMSSAPVTVRKAAQVIEESGLTDASLERAALTARSELGTLTNLFTSAGYKRNLAEVLVKRVLNEMRAMTKKGRRT